MGARPNAAQRRITDRNAGFQQPGTPVSLPDWLHLVKALLGKELVEIIALRQNPPGSPQRGIDGGQVVATAVGLR